MPRRAIILAALLLVGCGPAESQAPRIAQKIGSVTGFLDAYTFKTPDGARCVLVAHNERSSLSCSFRPEAQQ